MLVSEQQEVPNRIGRMPGKRTPSKKTLHQTGVSTIMKKLLKHALLICAGLSAGALYAPGMPAATSPNDRSWWTEETIGELVSSLKLRDKKGEEMPAALLQEVVNLVPKESFSLKRLYHTMLSTIERKRTEGQRIQSIVAGSTYAVQVIERLARDQNLVIHLDNNDFTPKTVFDRKWWSVYYPGANRHISHISKKELPVQLLSCRGLRMIVAQMNQGNQSLDQALKDVKATTPKNNQNQISALNGAERIIEAAQQLAREPRRPALKPRRPALKPRRPALPTNTQIPIPPLVSGSPPSEDDGQSLLPQNQYWLDPDALTARLSARLNCCMENFELYFEEWRKRYPPKPTPEPPSKRQCIRPEYL